jgi:hypothetical protein
MNKRSKRAAIVARITCHNQSELLEYIRSRGIKLSKKK